MTLRHLLGLATTMLVLTLLLGCQSSSSGGGSSGAGTTDQADDDATAGDGEGAGNDNDNGTAEGGGDDDDTTGGGAENDNTGDNDNVADEPANENADGDEQADLTDEEEEAVESTVTTIGDLAALFAALGAAQLPDLEGPIVINPFTGCPTLTVEGAMAFTIDYGDGCTPVLYPESTFAGSISAVIDQEEQIVTLTFNDFVVDGETVNGTVVAGVSQEGDTLTLDTQIDVTFVADTYTMTYTGDVTVEVNLATGEIFIPYGDLTATDQTGDTYAIVLENVHIDMAEVLPDSGTATVVLGTEGPGAITMVITFTDNTPVNGEVLVSVNGSPPVAISLDEIDLDP